MVDIPVTIGVCVRNSRRTIAEALTSILVSDYPKDMIEVVLVDGVSTDGTVEIVSSTLKGSPVHWRILSDQGRGLAHARQLVVDNSEGEYIVWVDGDNVVTPSFIKNHVEFMEFNAGVGVACAITLFKGETLAAKLQGYGWMMPTLNAIKKDKTPHIGMQGSITRRSAVENAGGFDSSIKGAAEDIDLFIRMKMKGWKVTANPRAKIYHYMKDTFRGVFREARWWGVGIYYVQRKYAGRQFEWKQPRSVKTIKMLLGCVKLTLDTVKATKDLAGLLMPLYCVIRRAGYLMGYVEARKKFG